MSYRDWSVVVQSIRRNKRWNRGAYLIASLRISRSIEETSSAVYNVHEITSSSTVLVALYHGRH